MKITGHVPSADAAIEASIDKAKRSNLFEHWEKRSAMKLPADATKVVLAIPMGNKDDPDVFQCPHCEKRSARVEKLRSAGLIPVEFLMNALQIVPPLLCSVNFLIRKSVPSALAREEMTYEAIKRMGAKYIFYWDDDVLIHPHAIYDLHAAMERQPDAGAISGVYVTRQEQPEPILYKENGTGAYWDFTTVPGVLEEGFAAGAGCLMARVEALEDVERHLGRPWWDDEFRISSQEEAAGHSMFGHDIRFCKRIREAGELFKPEHDIGWMTKNEAVELAKAELTDLPDESSPMIANRANEIMEEAREKRRKTLIDAGSPVMPWRFYIAGWIQCYHFDVRTQRMYGLPPDSKPFKNSNTKGYWDRESQLEAPSANGWQAKTKRGTEGWLHPFIAEKMIPEGASVLDLGCFQGAFGDRIVKTRKARYYGVDLSEHAIAQLKAKFLDGEQADLRTWEIDERFMGWDIVTSFEVLEHLTYENAERLVKEMGKFGKAIVSVPYGHINAPEGEHVEEYDKDRFEALMKTGFKFVDVIGVKPHFLVAICAQTKAAFKEMTAWQENSSGSSTPSRPRKDRAPRSRKVPRSSRTSRRTARTA